MEFFKFTEDYHIGFIAVQHFHGFIPMATAHNIELARKIAKIVCEDNPDMEIHITRHKEIIETYIGNRKIFPIG